MFPEYNMQSFSPLKRIRTIPVRMAILSFLTILFITSNRGELAEASDSYKTFRLLTHFGSNIHPCREKCKKRGCAHQAEFTSKQTSAISTIRGGSSSYELLSWLNSFTNVTLSYFVWKSITDVKKLEERDRFISDCIAWDDASSFPIIRLSTGRINAFNASVCFSNFGMLWKFEKRRSMPVKKSQDASAVLATEHEFYIFCAYESITAFDLQLERTLADRSRIPLLRLTVEVSAWPVVVCHSPNHNASLAAADKLRMPVAGRLMLAWLTLSDASLLEGYLYEIQSMRRAAGAAVAMVLPSWVSAMQAILPPALYSPGQRRAVERLVVVWMLLSGLWALWQLYQHVDMFAAALRPVARILVSHFGRVVRVRSAQPPTPLPRPPPHTALSCQGTGPRARVCAGRSGRASPAESQAPAREKDPHVSREFPARRLICVQCMHTSSTCEEADICRACPAARVPIPGTCAVRLPRGAEESRSEEREGHSGCSCVLRGGLSEWTHSRRSTPTVGLQSRADPQKASSGCRSMEIDPQKAQSRPTEGVACGMWAASRVVCGRRSVWYVGGIACCAA
jgi:hypothetical protein